MNINEEALYVTAVRKGDYDRITDFKLNDGREISYVQCMHMVDSGEIPSLTVGEARDGSPVIRSKRGYDNYSLDSLPTF